MSIYFIYPGNPDSIRKSQILRNAPVEAVDEVIEKDSKWRFLTGTADDLRAKRNKVQKEVGTKKKAKEPCDDLVAQIKSIGKLQGLKYKAGLNIGVEV